MAKRFRERLANCEFWAVFLVFLIPAPFAVAIGVAGGRSVSGSQRVACYYAIKVRRGEEDWDPTAWRLIGSVPFGLDYQTSKYYRGYDEAVSFVHNHGLRMCGDK